MSREAAMAADLLRFLLTRLRRAADPAGDAALTDAELLERFVARRDEAAFELLVWRHGTMVLNLCRRLLRDEHDAEDAFQATFLILARKAGSIGKRESCASWLYKVAFRVALATRSVLARRAARESPCPAELPAAEAPDEFAWRDLRPVLDEEVRRLPEKYRAAFVLCCLQGRSNAEAAQELGCPPGTVLSRLSRARERLRRRLLRRGVCLSAALIAAVVTANAQAAPVTADLAASTSKAALGFAAGRAAATVVSARAAALTEGVIRAMFMSKLKLAVGAVVVALGLAGLGTGFVGDHLTAAPPPAEQKPKPTPAVAQPPPVTEKRSEPDDPTKAALRRRQSRNNLKQIGVALQNYEAAYGKFPAPAIYSKDGKPLLSWRVAILPFIEQDNLYKQFHLDEPWDSAHNKPFSDMVVKAYAAPGATGKDGALTYYQAIVGEGAAWEPKKQLPISSFVDGTSNTIMVVEAATPVPWAKPEDLPFVPDQALPKLGGLFGGNFHALMVDGGVMFLSDRADPELLSRAITRGDGYPIDFDKLHADGRVPTGKVDLDDLPRQNKQLREAVEAALKEVDKEKEKLDLLKAAVAAGAPKADEKTAKLLKEHEELQQKLDKALEQLDAIRAERERLLEGELHKSGGEKPKPRKP
jgi:RNA polymerase sigma factor (sigma-70 family)